MLRVTTLLPLVLVLGLSTCLGESNAEQSAAEQAVAGKAHEEATEIEGWLGPPTELDLTRPSTSTLIGFNYKTPPPWPRGNHVSVDGHAIANMHTENLGHLRKHLALKTVMVRSYGDTSVLIDDERIGREWLLYNPQCFDFGKRVAMYRQYRKYFAPTPDEVASLLGVDWELVDHKVDSKWHPYEVPEDYMDLILPQKRIEFQETSVLGKDVSGKVKVESPWLLDEIDSDSVSISIGSLDEKTGKYHRVSCDLIPAEGKLRLVPKWWHNSTGLSSNLDVNGRNEKFVFRRVSSQAAAGIESGANNRERVATKPSTTDSVFEHQD